MRKTRFTDCDPRWASRDGARVGVSFGCPEADGGCDGRHVVPTSPAYYGADSVGPVWTASEDLAAFTLSPSVICRGACRMHIIITGGTIEFCGDSKSGPDWSRAEGE